MQVLWGGVGTQEEPSACLQAMINGAECEAFIHARQMSEVYLKVTSSRSYIYSREKN